MNSNAQYAYRYLQEKFGLTPEQAAGVVGNLMQESSLRTGAINPGDGSDGSNSIGIAQWNGNRARNLRAFASEREGGVNSLDNQLDFVMHELKTDERAAYDRLMNAQDVKSATAAFIGYERPQGWSAKNPYNGHGWNNRFKYAATLHGMSPQEIAQAQTAQSATLPEQITVVDPRRQSNTSSAAPPVVADNKRIFETPKIPEKTAGTMKNVGSVFANLASMAQEDVTQKNANVAKGGLLNRGQSQFTPNMNAQAPVPSGLLASALATPVDDFEERKRRLFALGGGLGGLGGLGGFV